MNEILGVDVLNATYLNRTGETKNGETVSFGSIYHKMLNTQTRNIGNCNLDLSTWTHAFWTFFLQMQSSQNKCILNSQMTLYN